MEKSIIRTYSAGVFYGEVEKIEHEVSGVGVTIRNCRRIWRWEGAASLSQLAKEGPGRPGSKITVAIDQMQVFGVIEIIPCSEKAVMSIESTKAWRV